MTTDLSLKAESECIQYYLCLISEDVETIYHNIFTRSLTFSAMHMFMQKRDNEDLEYRSYE